MKIRDPLLQALIDGGHVELHTLPPQLTGARLYQLSQGAEPETPEETAFLSKRTMNSHAEPTPERKYQLQTGADAYTTAERAYIRAHAKACRLDNRAPQTEPRQADHFPMEADYQISYDRGDD